MLASGGRGPQASELARRLAVLRGLLGQPDPTLRRATTATAPGSASSLDLATLIGIGAASGLGAGPTTPGAGFRPGRRLGRWKAGGGADARGRGGMKPRMEEYPGGRYAVGQRSGIPRVQSVTGKRPRGHRGQRS